MPIGEMKKCPYCAEDILAAAIKCKYCKSSLDAGPLTPKLQTTPSPKDSASDDKVSFESKDQAKRQIKHAAGIIAVTLVIVWLVNSSHKPEPPPFEVSIIRPEETPSLRPAAVSTPIAAPVPPQPIVLPVAEQKLIEAVSTAQRESQAAANDMQRGGFKNKRDKAICASMTSMQVSGWIGTIDEISANSDGKGVLAISLAADLLVTTYNNDISDGLSGDKTLIDPSGPLFAKVSVLQKGQKVRFSGRFFKERVGDGGSCLEESSVTLEGKLSKPEFIFRFTDVSPVG